MFKKTDKLIEKIKELYSEKFEQDVKDSKIDIILENECRCDYCSKSIFNMDDFPEIIEEDKQLLCEGCYEEKYYEICPICENSYDTRVNDNQPYLLNKEDAKEDKIKPGIYDERPDSHNWITQDAKLIVPIDISYYESIDRGEKNEIESGHICPECEIKFKAKERFIENDGRCSILFPNHPGFKELFSEYTDERIHKTRRKMISQRITLRGIIETANKKEDYVLLKKNWREK